MRCFSCRLSAVRLTLGDSLAGPIKLSRRYERRSCFAWVLFSVVLWLSGSPLATAGTWTPLKNPPPNFVSSPLLLTDGTVIAQEVHSTGLGTGIWYQLTPDNTGSYINGTWSQIASMPGGYAPDFYASAVLPDGRVIVEGGEYDGNSGNQVETNIGAIYNPANGTWTSVNPPVGWSQIGDAQSVVLANGTFMLGNCCYSSQALLNASNLTWTIVGNGKADSNSEEGWTLLPNGKTLVADVWSTRNSELFDPATQTWSGAGSIPVYLVNLCEIGPAVLRPDGTVLALGATGSTAIYNTSTAAWTAGPPLPSGYVSSDAPAALLPSGNVLVGVGSAVSGTCANPIQSQRIYFYEFNGTGFTFVGGPVGDFPYEGRLLVLPSGDVLWTHNSNDVQVYSPGGTYQSAWQPSIVSVNTTLYAASANNLISGTQFNGLSQGAMFGDDSQAATNYPLLRIKNTATGHVFYAKTHDHSTMGVASGTAIVSTQFDLPRNVETGASTLMVVANGIPSNGVAITVTSYVLVSPTSVNFGTWYQSDPPVNKTVTVTNNGISTLTINSIGQNLSAPFSVYGTTCGSTLGVGAQCTVTVRFTPADASPGTNSDTLSIIDSAPDSPQNVPLTGTMRCPRGGCLAPIKP